ncbi:hypothetical protein [Helicobacter pylori]|uniref:hypothetical protein n=1 Tax=Helicobacter pylori TaxID=210 RepID=UPI002DD95ED6|nr:hypothetical protein [Helicobacter pylori]
MFSKSVCHFCFSWHAPYNVGLPHIATMGRDEILQQTPLKHPQIASNTHGKVLRPIMTTQLIKLIFIG